MGFNIIGNEANDPDAFIGEIQTAFMESGQVPLPQAVFESLPVFSGMCDESYTVGLVDANSVLGMKMFFEAYSDFLDETFEAGCTEISMTNYADIMTANQDAYD